MSKLNASQTLEMTKTNLMAAPSGLLQRKCACGNHTIAGSKCNECNNKKGILQRKSVTDSEDLEIPPIVYEVLNSSGQPLDDSTRAFFESRFSHNFSHVRVHTDTKAAKSVQAVNALAYTVGHNVVFDSGQYAPGSSRGRKLLAHELAHVVQQRENVASSSSSLRVDAAGSRTESQADVAADAVLKGYQPAITSPVSTMISRQPAPTAGESLFDPRRIDPFILFAPQPTSPYTIERVEQIDDDTRRVIISTGQRYRVIRQRTVTREVSEGRQRPRAGARPGIDRENVWLDVEFCQGATEGRVRIGANIPDQILRAMLANVTSGGDIDAAIRAMRFTPFLEAQIQIRNFRLTARGETTVDPTGGRVTGAQGRVGVEADTPAGRVGGSIQLGNQQVGNDPLGGVTGSLVLEWTPGAEPRQIPDCRPRRVTVVERISFRCDEETTTPARDIPRTRQVPRRDERQVYLYFQYANARLDSQRSASSISQLRALLGEGYRVTGVHGFTSPEGTQASGRRFQGNEQLSRERAEAAVYQVQQACADPSGVCFANPSPAIGYGELYTLTQLGADGQEHEVEGPAQADEAAAQFRAAEAETSHRTPEVERRLDAARSSRERADIVYPLLRRAAIILERTRSETEHYTEHIEARTNTRELLGGCPDDIRLAAFPVDERAGGGAGPRR